MAPRAKNLDDIAPDDPAILSSSTITTHKKYSVSRKSVPSSTQHKNSKINQFRKEVYSIIGRHQHPMSAFISRPKKTFAFQSQFDGEEILLVLRKHPITQLRWIFISLFMSFLPFLAASFSVLSVLPLSFIFLLLLFWYLIIFAYILESFLSWYFNVNIITDERIVDIDFYSLMYKEISDAELEDIQDVTVKQGGVLHTSFDYGSVYVQTAAEIPEFEFIDIPKPAQVQQILRLMRSEEKLEEMEGRIK